MGMVYRPNSVAHLVLQEDALQPKLVDLNIKHSILHERWSKILLRGYTNIIQYYVGSLFRG